MARAAVVLTFVAVLAGCGADHPSAVRTGPTPPEPTTAPPAPEPSTTTTSTTEALVVVSTAPAPVRPTTTLPAPVRTTVAPVQGEDFWYRLALCESGAQNLTGNGYAGYFQLGGGTAEKVGWYPDASYEAQVAMAQDWAARLRAQGTSPGSTAGWPVCWYRAGGS